LRTLDISRVLSIFADTHKWHLIIIQSLIVLLADKTARQLTLMQMSKITIAHQPGASFHIPATRAARHLPGLGSHYEPFIQSTIAAAARARRRARTARHASVSRQRAAALRA